MEGLSCFNCRKGITRDALFCPSCRSRQRKSCGRCRRETGDKSFFCKECKEKAITKAAGKKRRSISGRYKSSRIRHQVYKQDRPSVFSEIAPTKFRFKNTPAPEQPISILGEAFGFVILSSFWAGFLYCFYNLPRIFHLVLKL
ncbi:hypothetical protein ACFL35_04355 [Candidatus Riflebacteria bacterium]